MNIQLVMMVIIATGIGASSGNVVTGCLLGLACGVCFSLGKHSE